jgi:hypothetical protein
VAVTAEEKGLITGILANNPYSAQGRRRRRREPGHAGARIHHRRGALKTVRPWSEGWRPPAAWHRALSGAILARRRLTLRDH